jgi:hypothetical protein
MRVQSKVALRGKRHRERVALLSEAAPSGIRVVPQEQYRSVLKHPKAGGFPAEGGKEWPDDRFTKRRLADGSVTREAPPTEGGEGGEGQSHNRQRRPQQHPEHRHDNGDRRQDEERGEPGHRVEHHNEPKDAA